MTHRWTLPLLVASFCTLSLGMIYLARKPLCIDSKVVDRIDRIGVLDRSTRHEPTDSATPEGAETVYRCTFNQKVPFSAYFHENLPEIEARTQFMERFIESIEPFKGKIQLVIIKDKPRYFLVKDHAIYISETLLKTPGHFEKALFKVWYRENSHHLFAYENLFEEVTTDFLLYLAKGAVRIEDPFRGLRTHAGGSRWPQVLKSTKAYCESPWKNSEHFQFCSQLQQTDSPLQNQVLELSLRPLLVSTWISAYGALSFQEQYEFIHHLRDLIAADHDPALPPVRTGGLAPESAPLEMASEAVRNFTNYFTTSKVLDASPAERVFVSQIANQLKTYGFSDGLGQASFDMLFISESPLSEKSEQFQHLLKLSHEHPDIKMAVKDPKNLWMLPSDLPIAWTGLEGLHAHRTIYSKCGTYDFNFVWSFANLTEKLMILNVCKDQSLRFDGYLANGPESFGAQNKNVPFIQFHIPSLLMRKDQLSRVENIYDLVTRREVDNPVFQSLGWQDIHWSEKAQAYQPKSFVDGIEWFKTQ